MPREIAIIQHMPGNTLGNDYHAVLADAGLIYTYYPASDVFDGTGWQSLPCDGWIFLGGDMNVDQHDAYPHLAHEKHAIATLLAANTPVLGICLGAQLMARALGAQVTRMPKTEVGWIPLTLSSVGEADPIMSSVSSGFSPFQWHNDRFDLPAGIPNLAYTEHCRHQAFRVGRHGLAVQFHPEVSRAQIADWLSQSDSLPSEHKARLNAQTDQIYDQQALLAQTWLKAYLTQAYPT